MRKPREFRRKGAVAWCKSTPQFVCQADEDGSKYVISYFDSETSKPKHLRDLAAWLLKAADWLEEKEGR